MTLMGDFNTGFHVLRIRYLASFDAHSEGIKGVTRLSDLQRNLASIIDPGK